MLQMFGNVRILSGAISTFIQRINCFYYQLQRVGIGFGNLLEPSKFNTIFILDLHVHCKWSDNNRAFGVGEHRVYFVGFTIGPHPPITACLSRKTNSSYWSSGENGSVSSYSPPRASKASSPPKLHYAEDRPKFKWCYLFSSSFKRTKWRFIVSIHYQISYSKRVSAYSLFADQVTLPSKKLSRSKLTQYI